MHLSSFIPRRIWIIEQLSEWILYCLGLTDPPLYHCVHFLRKRMSILIVKTGKLSCVRAFKVEVLLFPSLLVGVSSQCRGSKLSGWEAKNFTCEKSLDLLASSHYWPPPNSGFQLNDSKKKKKTSKLLLKSLRMAILTGLYRFVLTFLSSGISICVFSPKLR